VAVVALDQRAEALKHANRVRLATCDLRREIRALGCVEGRLMVAGLLEGDVEFETAGSMSVWRLVGSISKLGPVAAGGLLRKVGVLSGDRRVRDLSVRQRVLLASMLRGEELGGGL
jgi:hypothetical protein